MTEETKNKMKACLFKKSSRVSSDERFKMIVKAATPLFIEKGFATTTTKEIARAAGISEGLLYKHFSSKEALYKEIQNLHCCRKQAMTEALVSLPSNSDTLVLALYLFFNLVLNEKHASAEEETVKYLMMQSLLDDGLFVKTFLSTNFTPIINKMSACIEAAVKAGDLEDDFIPPHLCVWFGHHLVSTLGFMGLPDTQVIDYGCPKEEVLVQAVRFTLRGTGMKSDVLKKKTSPKYIAGLLSNFKHPFLGE